MHNQSSAGKRTNSYYYSKLILICLYLGLSNAFGPNTSSLIGRFNNVKGVTSSSSSRTTNTITMSSSNGSSNSSDDSNAKNNEDDANSVSGSFFNRVPPQSSSNDSENGDVGSANSGNEDVKPSAAGDNSADPFDVSMLELMRNRNKKPLASQPSTVGGVPTSQAKGFGKQPKAEGPQIINKTTSAPKNSFVGIGKPLNDINKPEYDDQGYTLYADEETGKKSRVFEALVEYPCEFKMKIIGANEGTFASEMVQVVADSCNVDVGDVKHTERMNGKWVSVTVFAPVESAEMLYTLYENIDRDPRVKFKF